MKKSILIISLLVFAFAAYAQNTALIRERGYKAINSQNTRENGTVFCHYFGDNDTLYFCVTDEANRTVETCFSGQDFEWETGLATMTGDVEIPSTVTHEGVEYTVTAIGAGTFQYLFGLTSVTIPNTVTEIKASAFSCCEGLQSVSIPTTVTSIGNWAFYGCATLPAIRIPASVTTIDGAFLTACIALQSISVDAANPVFDSRENCNALIRTATNELMVGIQTTTIPSSVQTLGDQAFMFQSALTHIDLPEGLTAIGSECFYNAGITEIVLPSTLTTLGANALYLCEDLGGTLRIPAATTQIGPEVISGSNQLTSIVVDPANPVFDSRENCNCIIRTDSNEVIGVCYYSAIPEGVRIIGSNIVALKEMPDTWALPSTVVKLRPSALSFCFNTKSIVIPDSVTEIPENAFIYGSYREIVLPDAIAHIGASAFGGCSDLTALYCKSEIAPVLSPNAFEFCDLANLTVYIPCGSRESYEATWNNSNLHFVEVAGRITVLSDDETMGSATLDTLMPCPENTAVITATANEGYAFSHWSDGDENYTRTVTVDGDATYIAYFAVVDGIEEQTENQYHIIAVDGAIRISGAEGSEVCIYDVAGRLVVKDRISDGKSYHMPQRGVYLVSINRSAAQKVVIW